jgi:hypothetical protein
VLLRPSPSKLRDLKCDRKKLTDRTSPLLRLKRRPSDRRGGDVELRAMSDSIDYVRRRADMFLRFRDRKVEEFASMLIFDACVCGASAATYTKVGRWHLVSSPNDWLVSNSLGLPSVDLFKRLVPMPEAGRNIHRHEAIVVALASGGITYRRGKEEFRWGQAEDVETIAVYVQQNLFDCRVVGFVA